MLQQTQVSTVLGYYDRWMRRFPDVFALARADEAEVLHAWQGLGYYSRARNLHKAARSLVENRAGKFPRDAKQLRSLPGIGRYTAGAVATFAFEAPEPIVDANIARVLARLLDLQAPIDSTAGVEALWDCAGSLQPGRNARLFNSALMELGALVCVPRAPKCGICPVRGVCRAIDPGALPRKKPRLATVAIEENCAFRVRGTKILLEQQTASRWRGLWKLPAIKSTPSQAPLFQSTYPFTHHRVQLRVFAGKNRSIPLPTQRWFSLDALPAMPSPHRRAVEGLR